MTRGINNVPDHVYGSP